MKVDEQTLQRTPTEIYKDHMALMEENLELRKAYTTMRGIITNLEDIPQLTLTFTFLSVLVECISTFPQKEASETISGYGLSLYPTLQLHVSVRWPRLYQALMWRRKGKLVGLHIRI